MYGSSEVGVSSCLEVAFGDIVCWGVDGGVRVCDASNGFIVSSCGVVNSGKHYLREGVMQKFIGTTQELAEAMGLEYVIAAGFLKVLNKNKIAVEAGTRATGKRPSVVYEIPTQITINLNTDKVPEEVKEETPPEKEEVREEVLVVPDNKVTVDMSSLLV